MNLTTLENLIAELDKKDRHEEASDLQDILDGLKRTNRILITVEGGVVQGVNSTFDCNVYILDLDGDNNYLIAPDGMELLSAYMYDVECEVNPEIVEHYVKQI
jgi:hypothetical protein